MSMNGVLPDGAYGNVKGSDYKPYVTTSVTMKEFSLAAIIIGLIVAIIFAMSNVYLGLKTGITISAGIPSGIIGVGILKTLRRNTVLQDNLIQSMGAMGESVAGGVIFILPAILLWGIQMPLGKVLVFVAAGACLGIFILTVFRRYLIEDEHGGELKFPESMAISEVIVNGSDGLNEAESKKDSGFRLLLLGALVGGLFKFIGQGIGFIKETVAFPFWKSQLGGDLYPSLLGLGYIIGFRVTLIIFSGGIIAWLLVIPVISFFGHDLMTTLAPGTKLISQMSPGEIWSSYIRYIGAGAVVFAGIASLIRNLPSIVSSLKAALGKKGAQGGKIEEELRSRKETPMSLVLVILFIVFFAIWFMPAIAQIKAGALLSFLSIVCIFLFGIVSARMCGVIGASNNPVSGMTIASLLIVTSVMKLMGRTDANSMALAIFLGSMMCTGISVAGGYAQSLKVGFLVGGTSNKVSYFMFVASILSCITSVLILLLIHHVYGIGSAKAPAPQGTLMQVIVEGIMGGKLPWDLIFFGMIIALVIFCLGLPVLLVAIGVYLPFTLTTSMFLGGIIALIVSKLHKKDPESLKRVEQKGTIFSSGLIAGDSILGILIVIFKGLDINLASAVEKIPFFNGLSGDIFSLICFIILIVGIIYRFRYKKVK
jgi:putative OPT family oligopeptide transporter